MSTPAPRFGELSAVKLALMAKKMRAEAQGLLRADPIAIVGMGCRAPGGVDGPARFWELLRSGTGATTEVPADRWDADAWFDPDPAAPAKMSTKRGGFLDRIDGFDAGYFGILPREAEQMDPQQRVFLEVAIEALDDAGVTRDRLRGSRSGVFIASYHNDYSQLQYADLEAIDARTLTGTLHSVLANRLSFILDLRGPSLSIDTACSSSLVALHLACQSLRTGESDLAITGGVSLMITPGLTVSLSKGGFMAPDGRCKTFDASADGFGRGEGCGVVILKRLADAISDEDRVLAVIRGSAVNQDGHSTLLAAPNGQAQQALIREALATAQMSPARIGFIEAHGTGTVLGDPIEVEALAATIGRASPGAGPCLLGAAKANVGHLEAAAGVIGVIKAVLALGHGAVPPQVGFHELNPHIALEGTRLAVPRVLTPWPRGEQPRCASVSAFGVGGTNAHVILEEGPGLPAPEATSDFAAGRLLPLSAQSPEALRALVEAWIRFLPETSATIDDVAYSAAERRSHYDHRLAVVGATKEALGARLAEVLQASAGDGALGRHATAPPRIALVFGGQGPQWYAMGRELLVDEPIFRDVVAECDALLRPLSGWSLLDELAATEAASRLNQTAVAQPALFAIQVALAALWKSWGLVADGVVGHSVGEIAALHVAGILALPEAIRVVWHRGQIMQEATGLGRMAQVSLTAADAEALVRPFGQRLSVGAFNGPRSVVLSGETAALESAIATLTARGVNHRLLPVQYAFHSAQMAPFQERLATRLGRVASAAPALAFYSTVTGGLATHERIDGAYVGRNVREPVRFEGAIGAMADDGFDAFVEIGPHPVLSASITETLDVRRHPAVVVASLRRTRPERESMLAATGRLYEAGWSPDFGALQPRGEVASLPPYPWQRKRYWIRARPQAPRLEPGGHPLLGRRVPAAGIQGRVFDGGSERCASWLVDHKIFGRVIVPAAAVMETLLAAARSVVGPAAQLGAFAMHQPLFLPDTVDANARWQTIVTVTQPGQAELSLYEAVEASATASEASEAEWRRIASATSSAHATTPASTLEHLGNGSEAVDVTAVYERFRTLGVEFGPSFRCLGDVRRGDGLAEGWIDLPPGLESEAPLHLLHPVLLDAGLQLCSLAAARGPAGELPHEVLLPLGADRFEMTGAVPSRVFARARVRGAGPGGSLTADVTFEAPDGASQVAVVEGMRFARAEASAFAARDAKSDVLYDLVWHRVATAGGSRGARTAGSWLVFADRSGVGDALIRALSAAGDPCSRVVPGDAFAKIADDTWTVNPADPAHLPRLLADMAKSHAAPLRGALHLWSLDVSPLDQNVVPAGDDDARVVGSVLHLVQGLAGERSGAGGLLWLVSRGAEVVSGDEPAEALRPRAAGLRGLASVIAIEHPELAVRHVDLDPRHANVSAAHAGGVGNGTSGATHVNGASHRGEAEMLLEALTHDGSLPRSAALRGQQWWAPRIERRKTATGNGDRPLRVELARAGLEGVELRRVDRAALGPGDVRLRVLASGINFRDVLMTLGMYPGEPVPLGVECAGVVTEVGAGVTDFDLGATVFGYAPGSLGTEVAVPAAFLARVPRGMSAEDAAGIPVAFLTAFYGLHRLAGLARGQRILIHAAAGGVGMAAVQLALRSGAEIFATAGSDVKRDLLRTLGVPHVMDSRSLAFADQIRAITGGQGVHVVLNSLAGEFIPASLGVLAQGGAFLELGKRDVMTAEHAAQIRPDARYHLYDLGSEAQADHALLRPMFDEILAALAKGELRPLPVQVYPLEQVADAFRLMAQAKHVGKVVVRVRSGASRSDGPLVSPSATYWITGGLGGVGLETARWLVHLGAKSLVLSGRRAPSSAARAAIGEFEKAGAAVRVIAVDAGDASGMRAVADEIASTLPPLRGVIHAAGVVDDAVLLRQTWERCRGVLHGKAGGAFILHAITRDLPLDFFVLYSAAGVLLGAPGQGPYAAANAELDALALTRRRLGLPALSVAWGQWADVGMGAELATRGADVWAARGLGKITPALGFGALERLIRTEATYAAVLPISWPRFLAQLSPGVDRAPFVAVDAERPTGPETAAAAQPAAVVGTLRALPSGQRRARLVAHLTERALQVIGLEATRAVDSRVALKEIGLDSLMAVELRNTLARSLGKPLPATLLFDYPTLEALADYLLRALALEAETTTDRGLAKPALASQAAATSADNDALADLSDQEAEALLLKELEESSTRSTHGG